MKKLLLLLLTFYTFSFCAQTKPGATYKEYMLEGNYLFLEENYQLALQNYEEAYALDSTNVLLNYNMGVCLLNIPLKKNRAEYHLEKAVKRVDKNCNIDNPLEKTAPPLSHYFYALALHLNYRFDDALEQLNVFEKYVNEKDKEWKKLLAREKKSCLFGKDIVNAPLNVQISSLGDSINSEYPDYSPVLSGDERTIIYTTRRPNSTGGLKNDDGSYNEDVVVSYKDNTGNWSSPVPLSANINGVGMEASINLTPDGQTLIVYRDGGDGMGGNIYYSTFDGTDWTPLKEFGSDVNSKYWESHACLSADGNVLIFVSDRPGGYGGRDIYRCVKLPTGDWSKALNMGSIINTEYDEDGAFIHPDGKTFFFTSNGHNTIGGFDIMFATLDENNQFSDVTNMGFPINTTDDDIFYVTSPDGKRGYFSSAKEGGRGDKDLYMVTIPQAREKALALFKGQIIPAEGESLPEGMIIIVKDKATDEIVGTYRPKSVNGTFSTILPPGREYTFSYQAPAGAEFYSEDVFVSSAISYQEIKREVSLEAVQLLGKVKAKSKNILLNVNVLENPKTKKPIENATITLTDNDGNTKSFTSNASGKHDDIHLFEEKEYSVVAEKDGKKSAVAKVSTKGIQPPKTLNQLLYVDSKAVSTNTVALDVLVTNKKKKPTANATVIVVDENGNKFEGITNSLGLIRNIPLETNTKYEVYATEGNNISEKIGINTANTKGKIAIKKSLILIGEDVSMASTNKNDKNVNTNKNNSVNEEIKVPEGEYIFYFKYNRSKIDETEETWTKFIAKVAELSKTKSVNVEVFSSASSVPTKIYRNNKQLASARAKKTAEKISLAVEAVGGNKANINFKRKSRVSGPRYRGDHRNRKKYEPHQYVKAKVF